MEESKEGVVLVGSVSEPMEIAGDDSETLMESMDTEVQGEGQIEGCSTEEGQIEGSSTEEEVLEEGELCDKGDVMDSGGDVSALGTETGVEDSPMLSDPSEGQNQGADVIREESVERDDETTDGKGVVTDDKESLQVESINDETQDDRIGTHADGTAEAVSSTEVESQNLQAVEVVAREGDANANVQAVGEEEAQATKEAANVKGEENSSGILVVEDIDKAKMVDDGVDAVQDIKMPEADNSVNGIQNSASKTEVTEHNQATEEEAAASSKQEDAEGGNSSDGNSNNSNEEEISVTKGVCGEPEREAVNSTGPGSLDEHKIGTSEGEFAVVSNEKFTCSKVEDSLPLSEPVQVSSGLETAAVDDKALSNSDKDDLDQSMAHDDAHVDSTLDPCNGFDKQVTQAKRVDFHEELETEVEQRQSMAETVNGDSGIHRHVHVDATSGQSSPVVVGDKIVVNSCPNVEISDYVDMDVMLSCSGKEQNLTAETVSGGTVSDFQAIDGDAEIASEPLETEDGAADSVLRVIQGAAVEGTEIMGPGAIYRPLKSGETVDENAARDDLEINSNVVADHPHNEQISPGQEILAIQKGPSHKRKHNLKDSDYLGKKERSVSELMHEEWDSNEDKFEPDGKSANKRRAVDSFAGDSANQEGRKTISFAKVSLITPSIPKPSFKIGECIRRVAPSILKCNSEKLQKLDGSSDRLLGDGLDASFHIVEDAEKIGMIVPVEYSSPDELLSQLHLAARDPFGEYEFSNVTASFFSDFRNSVVLEQVSVMEKAGRKRRMSHPLGDSPETFEFDDMSDTYWTDRIIQNGSEEQPLRKSRKREIDPIQGNRRSYSRRQYSDPNDMAARKQIGYVDENAPAELVMNFSEVDTVPSEIELSNMFKHFGPLKESETEVDKEASRARVVFKRCSDAEVAFSSAGKFGIFGPVAVNYQLNYTVLGPFRTPLVATTQGDEDTTLYLEY
ncbi:uncharacterized protein LOC119980855 isoform X2 [Tripterygium wilfordii]|uniref:uncharacterized protein LOC119980855 isoform X2 n=1 Tax=Tripterygium wilfordii TaxID=458696 RepID=UPI0018F7F2AB|nr:uncharacterized protein LOC119980855 isoform X2 [Tripterygium wilfordii]